jgi:hypothetical protein
MRTTVRLDNGLLEQARAAARQRHTTVTSLIEEGLRLVLINERPAGRRPKVVLPVSRETGGVLPGVDLNNSASLLDLMDERR